MTFEAYRSNRQVRRAVEREIEIISEASRRVPDHLKPKFPHIPWQSIASIGNLLRHLYPHVDDAVIWRMTEQELAPLEQAIRAMLTEIEEPRH